MKKLFLFLLFAISFIAVTPKAGAQRLNPMGFTSDQKYFDQFYGYSTGRDTLVITNENTQNEYFPGQTFIVKARTQNTTAQVYFKANQLSRLPVYYYAPTRGTNTSPMILTSATGVDSLFCPGEILYMTIDTIGTDKAIMNRGR